MSYSPVVGRFLQRDPLGYVDGQSLYQYEKAQVSAALDPSGMQAGGITAGPVEEPTPPRPKGFPGPWGPNPSVRPPLTTAPPTTAPVAPITPPYSWFVKSPPNGGKLQKGDPAKFSVGIGGGPTWIQIFAGATDPSGDLIFKDDQAVIVPVPGKGTFTLASFGPIPFDANVGKGCDNSNGSGTVNIAIYGKQAGTAWIWVYIDGKLVKVIEVTVQ